MRSFLWLLLFLLVIYGALQAVEAGVADIMAEEPLYRALRFSVNEDFFIVTFAGNDYPVNYQQVYLFIREVIRYLQDSMINIFNMARNFFLDLTNTTTPG